MGDIVYKNILKIRLEKKISQEYMAQELCISQAQYSKVERGTTNITVERLIRISKILKINIKDFFSIS